MMTGLDFGVAWRGSVDVHFGRSRIRLRGLELSRTTALVQGQWCLTPDRNVELTLELDGVRVFALATVEWSGYAGNRAVSRLRLGVTSPEGNDRIARIVADGRARIAPRALGRAVAPLPTEPNTVVVARPAAAVSPSVPADRPIAA